MWEERQVCPSAFTLSIRREAIAAEAPPSSLSDGARPRRLRPSSRSTKREAVRKRLSCPAQPFATATREGRVELVQTSRNPRARSRSTLRPSEVSLCHGGGFFSQMIAALWGWSRCFVVTSISPSSARAPLRTPPCPRTCSSSSSSTQSRASRCALPHGVQQSRHQ